MRVGSIVGKGVFKTTGGLDPETGQGKASAFWFTSAAGAELEVDTETGRVTVLKLASACNAGKAINPLLSTGQIEGSNDMALGFTFLEELVYDAGGQPLNPNFLDYHMPTILDTPVEVASILVEKPHPDNPYGAIGVGEATIPPVSPAIGNAIYNAAGVRVRDLPIKPEKVLRALRERAAGSGAAEGGRDV